MTVWKCSGESRYPGAFPPVLETFRRAFSPGQTDCPGSPGVVPVGFSDHCAIFDIRKLHRLKFPPPKTVNARNYKNDHPELFRADLNRIPWDIIELESDPYNAWNSYKDVFTTATDCNAPVVNRRVRGRSLPWKTPTIKDDEKARLSLQKSH